jgi:hypothetical protein
MPVAFLERSQNSAALEKWSLPFGDQTVEHRAQLILKRFQDHAGVDFQHAFYAMQFFPYQLSVRVNIG